MKTKTGEDLNIIGQVFLEGKKHYIVRLAICKYYGSLLYNTIILPAHVFDEDNGIPQAEVVTQNT